MKAWEQSLNYSAFFNKYGWIEVKMLINMKMKLLWLGIAASSLFSMERAMEEKLDKVLSINIKPLF